MGSFSGHALPGTFFLAFSFWQLFDCLGRYIKSHYEPENGSEYRNRASVTTRSGGPIEGYLKLLATTVGIIGKLMHSIHGRFFLKSIVSFQIEYQAFNMRVCHLKKFLTVKI